jgi:hypothetical protein
VSSFPDDSVVVECPLTVFGGFAVFRISVVVDKVVTKVAQSSDAALISINIQCEVKRISDKENLLRF